MLSWTALILLTLSTTYCALTSPRQPGHQNILYLTQNRNLLGKDCKEGTKEIESAQCTMLILRCWYHHGYDPPVSSEGSTGSVVVALLIILLWLYSVYRLWLVWVNKLNFDGVTNITLFISISVTKKFQNTLCLGEQIFFWFSIYSIPLWNAFKCYALL